MVKFLQLQVQEELEIGRLDRTSTIEENVQ